MKEIFPRRSAPIINIQVKGSKILYVTSELKTMIRQRDYFRAKANKTGSSVLRQAYGQVKANVNHRLYIIRKNYHTGKIEQHKYDFKNIWKILKGAVGKTCKTIKIEKISFGGKEFTDKKQIIELCNEHFVSVGDKLAQSIQPSDEQSPTVHIKTATVEFKFRPVSVLQVMNMIKKTCKQQSNWNFWHPHKALKDCAEHIAPSLTDIFNFSLETKVFADDLKVGKVVPVYKSGDKDDLNNY